MFSTTASITSSLPTITTTTPPPTPAVTMQGMSAITMPGAVTNDPASQRHNANAKANDHRPLERTYSIADVSGQVKAANSDRA